jgi:hypothetical protein
MENKNKISEKFKEQVKPFLDGFTDRLLMDLEKERIIVKLKSQDADTYYRLNINQQVEQSSKAIAQKDIFKDLFEFRNIVRNVFFNLKYPDSNRSSDYSLTQIISKLVERGAISAPWVKNKNVVFVIDKLDSLVGDDDKIRSEIEKTIADSDININQLILQLLEFYGVKKAENYFSDFEYYVEKGGKSADLIISHKKAIYPKLIFEFKYRKRAALPSKEIILRSLRQIEELSKGKNEVLHYFLVIFTQQDIGTFEKLRLEYIKVLREIKQYEQYKDRIRFTPIAVNYLHQIDDEFTNFKETHIEQDIRFVFRDQVPPKNQPDRNDHFFERTFEFKKSNFEIIITPGATKFWRFGFKFSQSEKFPFIGEDRHADDLTADVHITVGDLEILNNDRKWTRPNQLGLAVYRAELVKDEFNGINNYEGQPITLSVRPNDDGSHTEFEIKLNNKIIGRKVLNLSKYNFSRIHAWCDYGQFQLDTEIKVVHKG